MTPRMRRVAAQWDDLADTYRAMVHDLGARIEEIDRPLLEIARGDVLEVGCGDGRLLLKLPARSTRSVRGCDISAAMVAVAVGRGLDVVVAPAERLPLTDRSIDTYLSGYYALRNADLDRSCAEMARVLRPDGRFGITLLGQRAVRAAAVVASLGGLWRAEDRWNAARTLTTLGGSFVVSNDVRSATRVREILARHGLRLARVIGFPRLPVLSALLHRLRISMPKLEGDAAVPISYDIVLIGTREVG